MQLFGRHLQYRAWVGLLLQVQRIGLDTLDGNQRIAGRTSENVVLDRQQVGRLADAPQSPE